MGIPDSSGTDATTLLNQAVTALGGQHALESLHGITYHSSTLVMLAFIHRLTSPSLTHSQGVSFSQSDAKLYFVPCQIRPLPSLVRKNISFAFGLSQFDATD